VDSLCTSQRLNMLPGAGGLNISGVMSASAKAIITTMSKMRINFCEGIRSLRWVIPDYQRQSSVPGQSGRSRGSPCARSECT
jgi:hypothetical protein